MARRFVILFLAASLSLAITACKKEEPKPEEPIKKAQPAAQAAPQAAPASIDASAKADASVEASRRRNPFQSHILLLRGTADGPRKIKGPLECCELALFKVHAIVAARDGAFALAQAPDGKRYVVRKGDVIGTKEGKVIKIDGRAITVREFTRDQEGKVISTDDTDLKLPAERR
ncbi:MAG: hypothetical protein A2X93_01755 [Deltaproteobacteria bacterium GWC2_56_8]|nr:MAG: hypothetical protein A2X99_03510 [Deltaproteobacteria bacterium GWB2_55_19]OGP32161.1 MAG: hypothetical protein A2X93_01755 [Deltaproteobacteria bacterium GWC2_56_8]HAO93867.1 hypothetical protein [Deltaproteobacteria bacterium]